MLGLDQSTVASFLQLAVGGIRTGTMGHGDDEQDILFRMPQDYRINTDQLANITVPTSAGDRSP